MEYVNDYDDGDDDDDDGGDGDGDDRLTIKFRGSPFSDRFTSCGANVTCFFEGGRKRIRKTHMKAPDQRFWIGFWQCFRPHFLNVSIFSGDFRCCLCRRRSSCGWFCSIPKLPCRIGWWCNLCGWRFLAVRSHSSSAIVPVVS